MKPGDLIKHPRAERYYVVVSVRPGQLTLFMLDRVQTFGATPPDIWRVHPDFWRACKTADSEGNWL